MWSALIAAFMILGLGYLYILEIRKEEAEKQKSSALGKSLDNARKANEARNNPDIDELDGMYNRD